jgi:hypothetical protein
LLKLTPIRAKHRVMGITRLEMAGVTMPVCRPLVVNSPAPVELPDLAESHGGAALASDDQQVASAMKCAARLKAASARQSVNNRERELAMLNVI